MLQSSSAPLPFRFLAHIFTKIISLISMSIYQTDWPPQRFYEILAININNQNRQHFPAFPKLAIITWLSSGWWDRSKDVLYVSWKVFLEMRVEMERCPSFIFFFIILAKILSSWIKLFSQESHTENSRAAR